MLCEEKKAREEIAFKLFWAEEMPFIYSLTHSFIAVRGPISEYFINTHPSINEAAKKTDRVKMLL